MFSNLKYFMIVMNIDLDYYIYEKFELVENIQIFHECYTCRNICIAFMKNLSCLRTFKFFMNAIWKYRPKSMIRKETLDIPQKV